MTFCEKCGKKIDYDELFCSGCGNKIDEKSFNAIKETNPFASFNADVGSAFSSSSAKMPDIFNKPLVGNSDVLRRLNELDSEQVETTTTNNKLLWRAQIALEYEDWSEANTFCERILDQNPAFAEAYLIKLLAEYKLKSKSQLEDLDFLFDNNSNYKKLVRFCDISLRKELETILESIKLRIDPEYRMSIVYAKACDLMKNDISSLELAIEKFRSIRDYKDSENKISECEELILRINPVKADDSFCSICGTKLNDSDCQQVPQQPINPFTGEQVVNPFVNAQFSNISSVQNLLPEKTLDNTVQIAEQQPIPVDSKTDNAVVNSDNCNVEKKKLTFKTAISRWWHGGFEGRCSLKEYWYTKIWTTFFLLILLLLSFVFGGVFVGILESLFRNRDIVGEIVKQIFVLFLVLVLSCYLIQNSKMFMRRLHDLNINTDYKDNRVKAAIFDFIFILLCFSFLEIFIALIPGNSGSNKFGPPSEY